MTVPKPTTAGECNTRRSSSGAARAITRARRAKSLAAAVADAAPTSPCESSPGISGQQVAAGIRLKLHRVEEEPSSSDAPDAVPKGSSAEHSKYLVARSSSSDFCDDARSMQSSRRPSLTGGRSYEKARREGQELYRRKEYAAAARELREAMLALLREAGRDDATKRFAAGRAPRHRAMCFRYLGRNEEAIRDCHAALASDFCRGQTLLHIEEVLEECGDLRGALACHPQPAAQRPPHLRYVQVRVAARPHPGLRPAARARPPRRGPRRLHVRLRRRHSTDFDMWRLDLVTMDWEPVPAAPGLPAGSTDDESEQRSDEHPANLAGQELATRARRRRDWCSTACASLTVGCSCGAASLSAGPPLERHANRQHLYEFDFETGEWRRDTWQGDYLPKAYQDRGTLVPRSGLIMDESTATVDRLLLGERRWQPVPLLGPRVPAARSEAAFLSLPDYAATLCVGGYYEGAIHRDGCRYYGDAWLWHHDLGIWSPLAAKGDDFRAGAHFWLVQRNDGAVFAAAASAARPSLPAPPSARPFLRSPGLFPFPWARNFRLLLPSPPPHSSPRPLFRLLLSSSLRTPGTPLMPIVRSASAAAFRKARGRARTGKGRSWARRGNGRDEPLQHPPRAAHGGVGAHDTLRQFHKHVLRLSMGWARDHHAYKFRSSSGPCPGVWFGRPCLPHLTSPWRACWAGLADDNCVLLGEMLVKEGDRMAYVYDLTDRWEHEIVLLHAHPARHTALAEVVDGWGACPPEDVGGMGGYLRLLERVRSSHGSKRDAACTRVLRAAIRVTLTRLTPRECLGSFDPPRRKACQACGSSKAEVACERCHRAFYCCVEHQHMDWKLGHRLVCVAVEEVCGDVPRREGQVTKEEVKRRDLRGELEERERRHFAAKDKEQQLRTDDRKRTSGLLLPGNIRGPVRSSAVWWRVGANQCFCVSLLCMCRVSIGGGALGGRKEVEELVDTRAADADDSDGEDRRGGGGDDEDDDDDDEDDDEDDTMELLAELERIKKERAEEEAAQGEGAGGAGGEGEREGDGTRQPHHGCWGSAFAVKRRWDDDVVFRNQAKDEQKPTKRFINDTIRSDFHRRFLNKYMK
ncbi:unnamed protein product [Closterium sp. NIES-64]|nr:unnamed protein product [Closterium sp. NIES-64]